MSTAVWGFLGVILGGVLTGAASLLQAQLVARREREAQQALRAQKLSDERAAFQRDTILALQSAMTEFWSNVMTVHLEEGQPLADVLPPQAAELHWRINMLRGRVFDDELRRLVVEVQGQIHRARMADDPRVGRHHALEAEHRSGEMHERVNALLRELF